MIFRFGRRLWDVDEILETMWRSKTQALHPAMIRAVPALESTPLPGVLTGTGIQFGCEGNLPRIRSCCLDASCREEQHVERVAGANVVAIKLDIFDQLKVGPR